MRKTLTYSSFLVASLIVFAIFITATTYTQLGIAILLYPLLVYFALKIFPRITWKTPTLTIRLPVKSATKVEVEPARLKAEAVDIADIDKRAFLKMIGAAGISFFLFSLLNRRAENLFFGRSIAGTNALEDTTGRQIDPAERQPTDAYRISEIEDNDIAFYGFTNKDGGWYIMKEEDEGSFRYIKGESNFAANWANRERLRYGYFNEVF